MTLGKHFITGIDDVVVRALRNLLINDASLRLIPSDKVLYRLPPTDSHKVLLLSGGGSGHEPAHAGYVGEGMLDIAVCGNIFASPSASQVTAGLRAVSAPAGVLMIVKNYTGDVLNFGLAAEKAKADGHRVNIVIVEDDVSIEGNALVGQRGLAGTVFVHKIAGAAAAKGLDLDQVTRLAQKVADSLITVGVSLDKCSVPQRDKQEGLPFDEMEYGMGIHNEPGAKRSKVVALSDTVAQVVKMLLGRNMEGRSPRQGQKVAVMINNFGGLSLLEINVVAEEALQQLSKKGANVSRVVVGAFVTSLDGPGFSVTLLGLDEEIRELLETPTEVAAWPKRVAPYSCEAIKAQVVDSQSNEIFERPLVPKLPVSGEVLSRIIASVHNSIRQDEPKITEYDTLAGDGDCGETLLNGINALVRDSAYTQSTTVDLVLAFRHIASIVERSMGGTSGAIYAIFFNAVSSALSKSFGSHSTQETVASALKYGLSELCKYTKARKGHRTLMDALIPFVEKFAETQDLPEACQAASVGADGTKSMDALLGRASYVAKEQFEREGGIPDPGALGVVSVVRGVLAGLS